MQMRTTKPTTGNNFYITVGRGGYSQCIQGSPRDSQCDVLSNCVGYACGRFNEIIGSMKYPALNCNAKDFITRAKQLGLETSDKPSPGAIIVWNYTYGHVEVVEKVIDENTIYTSGSNYNGTAFYNSTRKKVNGNWTCWAGYTCIGFVKNPAVSDNDDPTPIDGKIVVGSKVNFSGGYIYGSSEATQPSVNRPASVCEVTAIGTKKSKHPYHLISRDGKGVYGWADASKVSLVQKKQLYSITIQPVSEGDLKMIENICNDPKYSLKYTTKEIN